MYLLKHHLYAAFRNLKSGKNHSLISLSGLVISISTTILIFQYSTYEQSYDSFHEKKDQLFRLQNNVISNETEEVLVRRANSFYAIQGLIEQEVPEVVNSTMVYPENGVVAYQEQLIRTEDAMFTPASFFEMFSFPLSSGSIEKLNQPNVVFLSESMAKRVFADEDPIQKRIRFYGEGTGATFELEVGGVFADIPDNSYFKAEVVLSKETFIGLNTPHLNFNPNFTISQVAWRWTNFYTFLELHPDADLEQASSNVNAFIHKYRKEIDERNGRTQTAILENIGDIHLNTTVSSELTPPSNGMMITLFYFIGGLIVIIAWVNYMNISTASAIRRAREVGVRKALGAHKRQLISQLITESIVLNLVAIGISIGIVMASAVVFEDFIGKAIFHNVVRFLPAWLLFAGCLMGGSIVSGVYPAMMLSSFKPHQVLKASFKRSVKGNLLRKVLLTFQFVIVCALLAMSFTVYKQIDFMINKDTGFSMDQKMIVSMPPDVFRRENYKAKVNSFVQQIDRNSDISDVSNSSIVPGLFNGWGVTSSIAGGSEGESLYIRRMVVGDNFPQAYGLRLEAGRFFNGELTSDYSEVGLINRVAMQGYGYSDPEEVIGKTIELFGNESIEVIGVIEDFHQTGMHSSIDPLVMQMDSVHRNPYMTVSIQNNIGSSVELVQENFERLFPDTPFQYTFLDQSFMEQYEGDIKFKTIFTFFTVLAIGLALMGLFALSTFFANQKKKEVSIRKVLGASASSITQLLLKEYWILVIIGGIISIPISYYITQEWVANFAYQIQLNPMYWIVPIGGIALIVVLTVARRTIQLANINPTENLRSE